MLKKFHREAEILHKFIDLFIIYLAWLISYYVRFETVLNSQEGLLFWYIKCGGILVFLSYIFFRSEQLYSSKRYTSLVSELVSTLRANFYSTGVFVVVVYFFYINKVSRILILHYFFLSSIFLVVFKASLRVFLMQLRKNKINLRHVVLIGDGPQLDDYIKKVKKSPGLGFVLVGWLSSNGRAQEFGIEDAGDFSVEKIRNFAPDSVVVGVKSKDAPFQDHVMRELSQELLQLVVLPDLSFSLVGYNILTYLGFPMIFINEPDVDIKEVLFKRIFDFTSALIGLVLLSPFLCLLALAVKLSSKGPLFYSQLRMGLDGRIFKMYKFRTMKVCDTNESGWTVKDDPRVTKIGKFMRRTSLDELPQLFNVLLGNMSLVGPRPERPQYVNKFKAEIPTYMLRHKMKAGITGWAQINGWRGDTSIEKRIEFDLYYIKNWSIWFDITIVYLTFWKGFINKNAY